MRLIWSPQAVDDVEAIRSYVARDSENYANLLVERIVAAVDRLETFPLSGRVVPEAGDESLREVVYGNYRICVPPKARGCRDCHSVSLGPPASA
jgi:toxin ParE1/3/4